MAVDHNNPQSRDEEILIATIDGTEYDKLPQSRMEELLLELKDVIESGSGGGSVHFVVVEELPTTDIDQSAIYLVPKSTAATSNVYDEYINTDGTTSGWELIGTTDIDLSDYITDDDLATVLEDYATTQDLSGKQDTLTAGKYINIDANNEIKVNPVVPNEAFTYTIKQIDDYSLEIIKTVNDAVVFDEVYSCYDPVAQQQMDVNETFDDAINIHIFPAGERSYTLLIASDAHEAGFKQTTPWYQRNTFVETFSTVDHTGEKLVIKSELDTALTSKQDKTDNNLTTTDKTTTGAINELKSGLTNVDVALNVPDGSGKNLLNSTLNSYSEYGVTITKNNDGTYELSGTATSTVWGRIIGSVKLKAGTYKLVGWNPNTPGTLNSVMIYIDDHTSINDYGQGGTIFTLEEETTYSIKFVINNGVTIDTIIKPMITEDINATYYDFAPYIPSVESRIEAVETKVNKITINLRYVDLTDITPGSAGEIDIESVTSGTVTHENLINIIPLNSNNTVLDVYTYNNNLYVRAHTRNDYNTPVTTDIGMRLFYSVGA